MEILKSHKFLMNIEKKLFLFFIVFSSTQMVYLESHFVFLMPVLCFCFVVGKQEVAIACLGMIMGGVFSSNPQSLLFGFGLFFLLRLMMPMYSLKTNSIIVVGATYLFLIEYFFLGQPLGQVLLGVFVASFMTYTLFCHVSIFVHRHLTYEKQHFYFIGLLFFYLLYPLIQLSPIFFMIWFRLLVLGILYVAGFEISYQLLVTISIFLLVNDAGFIREVIGFLIPYSLLFLTKPTTKLAIGTIYVFSHFLLPFIIETSIKPFVFQVVFSSLSFMMIPSQLQLICEKKIAQIPDRRFVSIKRKIASQLDNYSEIYQCITQSFQDDLVETSVLSYIGSIKENLCQHCINHQECFNKHKGDHRLIKLLKKGIVDGLNKEEMHYVECYCVHMAEYKKRMAEQHKLYKHQKEMNQEYHFLKQHLYKQLSLVGKLLKNYAENIDFTDQQDQHKIRELLEAYHYKVWYIHKENLSMKTFQIEIGMTEVTKEEVYDVVVPVIEKALDSKLRVMHYQNNTKQLGYTDLILTNHHLYDLILGFQQISKEKEYCGDSYLTFQHMSHTFVAISDGMGFGKKAHEQSHMTLEVFSRLIKSGIPLADSVQTMNALLRIKNRSDMYTTLDLILFDASIGEATFIKNGSMPTYIYRNQELITIEPDTPPIGIINEVHSFQKTIPLHEDDVLFLYSDGLDEGMEVILKENIHKYASQNPQWIADELLQEALASHFVDDDATLIVLKVKKVSN